MVFFILTGKITTPMFQFLVMKGNKVGQILQEKDYLDQLAEGFKIMKHNVSILFFSSSESQLIYGDAILSRLKLKLAAKVINFYAIRL